MKEYRRKAQEIRDRAKAENRSLIAAEEASVAAYEKAAWNSMLAYSVRETLDDLKRMARSGKLSGRNLERWVKGLCSTGHRKEAEQLLKLALISEMERSR